MKRGRLLFVLGALMLCVGCSKGSQGANETEKLQKETKLDESVGEAAPETELIEYESQTEHTIGEKITISSGEINYDLMIDEVSYLEKVNIHTEETDQVILIDYTYTNHSEEILLIDSMRFQLIDETDNTVYEPYYFEEKITAEPIGKGESFSAQIAFEQENGRGNDVLLYRDTKYDTVAPICVRIGTADSIE